MNIYLAKVELQHSEYMGKDTRETTYRLVKAESQDKVYDLVYQALDRYDAYASCTSVLSCEILDTINQEEPDETVSD